MPVHFQPHNVQTRAEPLGQDTAPKPPTWLKKAENNQHTLWINPSPTIQPEFGYTQDTLHTLNPEITHIDLVVHHENIAPPKNLSIKTQITLKDTICTITEHDKNIRWTYQAYTSYKTHGASYASKIDSATPISVRSNLREIAMIGAPKNILPEHKYYTRLDSLNENIPYGVIHTYSNGMTRESLHEKFSGIFPPLCDAYKTPGKEPVTTRLITNTTTKDIINAIACGMHSFISIFKQNRMDELVIETSDALIVLNQKPKWINMPERMHVYMDKAFSIKCNITLIPKKNNSISPLVLNIIKSIQSTETYAVRLETRTGETQKTHHTHIILALTRNFIPNTIKNFLGTLPLKRQPEENETRVWLTCHKDFHTL